MIVSPRTDRNDHVYNVNSGGLVRGGSWDVTDSYGRQYFSPDLYNYAGLTGGVFSIESSGKIYLSTGWNVKYSYGALRGQVLQMLHIGYLIMV